MFRELEEEVGTARAEILAEHPRWLTYDLPDHLVGQRAGREIPRPAAEMVRAALHRRRRATSASTSTRTRNSTPGAGRTLADLPGLAVAFKRAIYEDLAREFARFAG